MAMPDDAASAANGPDPPRPLPRIASVSTMCLLDQVSGAAISTRTALETLAAAGHEATAFTASLFDGHAEVPPGPLFGPEATKEENRGKVFVLTRNGVQHRVLLTASSQGGNMAQEEAQRLFEAWREWLARMRPEIVLGFGNSMLAQQLRAAARAGGVRIIHYFANAEIDIPDLIQPGDRAICCSQFLARLYRERYGIATEVIYPVIEPERVRLPDRPVLADRPELRRLGFVTFVSPLPAKGVTLVHRLVVRAGRERPEMKFLIVEGRSSREIMARMQIDLPLRPNVWWLPAQRDMAAVYARSAVLLMPSFWHEGFGRCAVEAQLAGVPVLAGDTGGLPEALGAAAEPLPIPERCRENYFAYPDDETVERWFAALIALWDDDEAYARASERARTGAQRFGAEAGRTRVLEVFAAIAAELPEAAREPD